MNTDNPTDSQPLSLFERVRSAAKVITTGKLPNPLASDPKDKSLAALVQELNKWCLSERLFWKPIFDKIKDEQRFAAGKQWPKDYKGEGNVPPYVGDIMQQMLNRKTAALYCKNPTPESRRRETLPFTIWDGDQASIDGAKALVQNAQSALANAQQMAAAGQPVPPMPPELSQAQALVADYEQGMARKALLLRVSETATLLLKSIWSEQTPDFETSMKQLVTRVLSSRVGYIKVMYRRENEANPAEQGTVTLADKLEQLRHIMQSMGDPDFKPDSAEAKQAELILDGIEADLNNPDQAIVKSEGVVYDFPSATSIILDRRVRSLRGFIGAHRIAHEILMTIEECETKYGVSLRDTGVVMYADDGSTDKNKAKSDEDVKREANKVCVWILEDKDTGLCYHLCDGLKNFLQDPEENEPKVKHFWSIIPVVFNVQEVEFNDPDHDVTVYPRSDVRLAMPMQIDINNAGEGLREHRVANRPTWVGVKARFVENDLQKLSVGRSAHTVLMLESLNPGEKVTDFIQPLPTQPIMPEMYSTEGAMQGMMLATGIQQADLGQQSVNEKATGQQIASQQKASTDGSNVDDLNFALSLLAQMSFEMAIQEMPAATVKEKIGAGAVWPDVPAERLAIMNEITLAIEAGSSGRPNQAVDVQNFTLIAPQLGQLMAQEGKSVEPLIKEGVRRLGDKLEVDDFLKPSAFAAQQQQAEQAGKQQPATNAPKPPSIAFAGKDLSPDERAQALAQDGIQATPGFVPASAVPKPVPGAPNLLNKPPTNQP